MKYALITGASKGIGRAIAFEFAKRNISPLLVARSEDLLKKLSLEIKEKYKIDSDYLAIDLSKRDSPAAIRKWCTDNGYGVSILINNAGYGLWGKFDSLSLADQDNMMQLNMITPVNLTYEMLPLLKQHKQSFILNTSSSAAYQAVPTLSVYAASKAFVLLFSRGLRYELKSSNVSVSCLSPGPTTSDFIERAGMNETIKKKAEKFTMSAEKVAQIAINGMFAKKAEIIPGFVNLIGAKITSITPKWLTEKFAAGLYE